MQSSNCDRTPLVILTCHKGTMIVPFCEIDFRIIKLSDLFHAIMTNAKLTKKMYSKCNIRLKMSKQGPIAANRF